jgi:hypothetical protein
MDGTVCTGPDAGRATGAGRGAWLLCWMRRSRDGDVADQPPLPRRLVEGDQA